MVTGLSVITGLNASCWTVEWQPWGWACCSHLCHPHHFYAGCPSWHKPPNLSWLWTGTKYTGLHTRRLVGIFIAQKWVDSVVSVEWHS